MSIVKARINSKPYDKEKGQLYIILTWNKKRSKSKHFAFYSKDFKIPYFPITFKPDYDWECDAFALKHKKVTSHYFGYGDYSIHDLKTVLSSTFLGSKHSLDKCYDGLLLKVEDIITTPKKKIKFNVKK